MRDFLTQNNFQRISRRLSRRNLLALAGGTGVLLCCPYVIARASREPVWTNGNPFSLGVAAGDPSPNGFVLWTRLALNPLSQDPSSPGGLTSEDLPVDYEISTDSGLQNIIRRGQATAEKRYAYSVHVEIK